MSFVRFGKTVILTTFCALLIILVVYNGPVDKYEISKQTSRGLLPSYVNNETQVSHNVEASPENKSGIKEKINKRRTSEKYDKLLYGVNISELQDRSYTQAS